MRGMRSDFDPNREIDWSIIKQIIPYLLEYKQRIALALLCLVAAKVASVTMPFILKHVVDDLDQQLADNELSLLVVPLGLLLAYGLVRLMNVLLGEIRDTLFGRVTERAMRRVGLKVFEHLHALSLSFHLNRQTGGLSRDIERGTNGISFLMRFLVFNIVPTFLELFLVMGILWQQYRFEFALIVLISVIAYVWFSKTTTDWRTQFIREANQADSKSNTRAIDSLLNYETVKYFTNEQYEADLYDKELEKWEQAKRKNRLTLFALNGGQALIISSSLTAMLVLAAHEVSTGRMTLGDFVLVNAFMMQIFLPLNFLGFVYREIKSSMTNIERMFGLLKEAPLVVDTQNAQPLTVSNGKIEFKDISFAYEPSRTILSNLSFTVQPGEKVALVGSSGAGKSTIAKLLFRFYDTSKGAILIDDQNIKHCAQHSLRAAIGVVPQDTVLFNTSLIENVRYGRPGASDAEVKHAIELAHLKDFVEGLPKQYETQVGERGLKLSGGEKQRVAIARTILKNPAILLFDEATSSLDSASESAVMEAIREVSAGKSSLVIAHRLSTVVDADRIIVIDKGGVVEQGSHHSLIKAQGLYAQLWALQQNEQGI
ncbi:MULTISPECIES: ABC transporter ATP-binding protein/permease [unclassified Oleiphilus]|jgi:ATP-binding cassette subfamily B protein|nr:MULTISPECIES: ABC transporter ATP-binding protein/permease [unclassified Oleiphilus]KZY48570.1 metal ABC transporter permease [Oleiphilus sp. HI0050]KZY76832.1 metal ABC transporter permease [Oleiphilus sp. HI0068]KZY78824.1 metal ABC transporter permease [Oleiphilus sp. HI0069]KZY65019.1 metal ABC transporter permease [Oleiphilus sp. HI0061]KZZ31946.1 metal ABC transporter permease [Oleiphilus sp. HI0117]